MCAFGERNRLQECCLLVDPRSLFYTPESLFLRVLKRFDEEADRGQWTLLPECLDDFIDESNPVRVIDAFVNALDLGEMGFEGVKPAALSSMASASNRFSRVFSSSSAFSRLASDTSIPPNFAFHL